jgi:hypothetical protein
MWQRNKPGSINAALYTTREAAWRFEKAYVEVSIVYCVPKPFAPLEVFQTPMPYCNQKQLLLHQPIGKMVLYSCITKPSKEDESDGM